MGWLLVLAGIPYRPSGEAGKRSTQTRLLDPPRRGAAAPLRGWTGTGGLFGYEADDAKALQAHALYATAAERWAGFGNAPERGKALLGAGRCLLSPSRPTEAAAKLGEAREVFNELGAAPLVDEADTLLGQATALPL
jgi:hypothetical protein